MMKAASVDELNEAMRHWVDPCNNLVSADVHGNIAYLHRGQVPVRSMSNAWLPVPGWSGEHEWQGSISFEALSRRSGNPSTGFIVSANNRHCRSELSLLFGFLVLHPNTGPADLRKTQKSHRGYLKDMRSIHGDFFSDPRRGPGQGDRVGRACR